MNNSRKILIEIEPFLHDFKRIIFEIIESLKKSKSSYKADLNVEMHWIISTLKRNMKSLKNNNSFKIPTRIWSIINSLKNVSNLEIIQLTKKAQTSFEPIWQLLAIYFGKMDNKIQNNIYKNKVICLECNNIVFSIDLIPNLIQASLTNKDKNFIKKYFQPNTIKIVIVYLQKYLPNGIENYCQKCNAFYCWDHCKSSGWESVAAGVDYQYRSIECPKGHSIFFEDSSA